MRVRNSDLVSLCFTNCYTSSEGWFKPNVCRKLMNKQIILCFFICAVACPPSSFAALDRVFDFALLDGSGEFHQLSRYKHRDAVVLMAYDHFCESMSSMVQDYQAVANQFSERDIDFLLIDSLDLGRSQLASFEIGLPILEDDGQLVSESLGIQKAGEVIVLNPHRLSIYFRGSPSDDLPQTLDSLSEIEDTLKFDVPGCELKFPVAEQHTQFPPDYETEVAPIIIENCVECHRQGGVGPFALDSYIMLLGWSPMIREVILNKRMPPTQVDPYIGHSDDARRLEKSEMQTLVHWINAGAPRGAGESDPLELFNFSPIENWFLGPPDHIASGASNDVPPTGVLDYIYDDIDLEFDEDKWVRAIQYKPGDSSVLHHLVTFVTAPEEDFWGPERNKQDVTRRFLGSYSPGKSNVEIFPKGTGVFIPKGYKLSMQFHYVTNGQRTTDASQLALYFSEEKNLQERFVQAVAARFIVPSNEPNHLIRAAHLFEENVVLTGVRAKMNYRGKKMKFAIEEVDGVLREIFSIPAYNYGWQPHYTLDKPEVITAGTRVHVIGAFDNSISNPANPDPDKELKFGLNSWDEMFTGYFTFHNASAEMTQNDK